MSNKVVIISFPWANRVRQCCPCFVNAFLTKPRGSLFRAGSISYRLYRNGIWKATLRVRYLPLTGFSFLRRHLNLTFITLVNLQESKLNINKTALLWSDLWLIFYEIQGSLYLNNIILFRIHSLGGTIYEKQNSQEWLFCFILMEHWQILASFYPI